MAVNLVMNLLKALSLGFTSLLLILLACLPLFSMVFVKLAHLPADSPLLRVLSWDETLLLIASLLIPLFVLRKIQVHGAGKHRNT